MGQLVIFDIIKQCVCPVLVFFLVTNIPQSIMFMSAKKRNGQFDKIKMSFNPEDFIFPLRIFIYKYK